MSRVTIPNASGPHLLLRVWEDIIEYLPIVAWSVERDNDDGYIESVASPITIDTGGLACEDFIVLQSPSGREFFSLDMGRFDTEGEAVEEARERLRMYLAKFRAAPHTTAP
jgi:hypothetical protein